MINRLPARAPVAGRCRSVVLARARRENAAMVQAQPFAVTVNLAPPLPAPGLYLDARLLGLCARWRLLLGARPLGGWPGAGRDQTKQASRFRGNSAQPDRLT